MKKITNLKAKLNAECTYPALWTDSNCGCDGKPRQELAYLRCDHDGYCWHHTLWPVNREVSDPQLIDEFNAVFDAFRRAFKDRNAMSVWCHAYAALCIGAHEDEFSAYYDGVHGFYWFRMITRRGDYNLYLHCYSKNAMQSMLNAVCESR